MHLLLWAEASEAELRVELGESFPGTPVQTVQQSLLGADFPIPAAQPLPPLDDTRQSAETSQLPPTVLPLPGGEGRGEGEPFQTPVQHSQRLPYLAFARQLLPNARPVQADSIRALALELFTDIVSVLPDNEPWSLHIEPHYGTRITHRIGARAWHSATRHGPVGRHPSPSVNEPAPAPEAGRHRCRLIREALLELLQRKRRHLLRQLRRDPAPFTPGDSLVQLLLTAPDTGYISVAPAPVPFQQRHLISPFPKGEVPVASDKAAPSRAFAKLVEAELRLGGAIQSGETCVDLGASPGSWTYVAVNRGARVLAVDRSPLREDLMRHRRVEFLPGDAFGFQPKQRVDWLLCDVIAPPERTASLLLEWLRRRWCRHFVVTIKLKDAPGVDALLPLKRDLPALTSTLFLTRLCANKKEVCVFGSSLDFGS